MGTVTKWLALAVMIAASLEANAGHVATTQEPAGATFPTAEVIPDVTCAADASQRYALYLPREYSPDRSWPLILAFDPGGRGRTPVERYQAAAERYGYIVAGSNNSRNGSTDLTRIIGAFTTDVLQRFRIDQRRVYTAGMSGGARVALMVALETKAVAGVIASSAGYPDSKPRKTLPFSIFATAGAEDFNHLEMRRLDEALTSPHRLAIFQPSVVLPLTKTVPSRSWSCGAPGRIFLRRPAGTPIRSSAVSPGARWHS
jgi:poly(3-hydroxybutyrate) depolymerase